MPQILVVTDSPASTGEVLYRERIASSDLTSEHFSGQLVERVRWAVGDAAQVEHRAELFEQATERAFRLTDREGEPRAERSRPQDSQSLPEETGELAR